MHSCLKEAHVYQRVLALPRVQASDREDMSALATFLMELETRTMKMLKNAIEGANSKVLSILFDGIHILAQSQQHLVSIFNTTATQLYNENGTVPSLKSANGRSSAKAPF